MTKAFPGSKGLSVMMMMMAKRISVVPIPDDLRSLGPKVQRSSSSWFEVVNIFSKLRYIFGQFAVEKTKAHDHHHHHFEMTDFDHNFQMTDNMTLLISVAVALCLPNVGGLPPAGARIPGDHQNNYGNGGDDDER